MRTCFPFIRTSTLTIRRWTTCVLIVLYTLGISGVPAGPGAMKLGCRCDTILQATGNCCCLKKVAAQASKPVEQESCCALRSVQSKPRLAACCQNKAAQKSAEEEEDSPVSVSACRCDSPFEAGFLLNTDPRVVADSVSRFNFHEQSGTISLIGIILQGRTLTPETPPPRTLPGPGSFRA